MKKWSKNLALSFIVSSLLIATGCGNTGGTENTSGSSSSSNVIQERTIKFATTVAKTHPAGQGMDKFAEIVSQKSGGQIKVQTYFDAALGGDKQMSEAVRNGTQEMAMLSPAPLVGTVKEFGIFDLPYTFSNEKEIDALLQGSFGQKMLDFLPQYDWIGLGWWESGFRNVTNNKRPITKAEDFKGLKIRTMENKIHLQAFKEFGANPTPMSFSEVFTALESEAIDGQENPVQIIETSRFNEVQKYLSLTKHVYAPAILLTSKKFWDQLSEEEKKILQEAADEAGQFSRGENRSSTQKTIENLKSTGMEVNEISPEEMKKMQEMTKPVIEQFSSQIGDDLVKEFFTELEKTRQ
ncbi:TRAP transporter substrate-binding protein [Ammoniphilus sp. YIM 78166]|uniref:TRAP transporter substrate-binding protein n=1 Tax=Ammoniphilus sp. YIM 78166 TaxID=1644106 RepID=UPI00106FE455|nr:TRAP transporter substrate-binding protein [Ammoniphilus sp. YIM 78166]